MKHKDKEEVLETNVLTISNHSQEDYEMWENP